MKSNYPRGGEEVSEREPSVLLTSVLAAVTTYLIVSAIAPYRGVGEIFGGEMWPYVRVVCSVLAGIPALCSAVLLWRGSRWSLRDKVKFMSLSAVLLCAIFTVQLLLGETRPSPASASFSMVVGTALYTLIFGLVGLLVWVPAGLVGKMVRGKSRLSSTQVLHEVDADGFASSDLRLVEEQQQQVQQQ